jgi:hypothetical protein
MNTLIFCLGAISAIVLILIVAIVVMMVRQNKQSEVMRVLRKDLDYCSGPAHGILDQKINSVVASLERETSHRFDEVICGRQNGDREFLAESKAYTDSRIDKALAK